jgi:arylsulfatase A-like enzyme
VPVAVKTGSNTYSGNLALLTQLYPELSIGRLRRESRKMELYAAKVTNLDRHVGRLVEYLKKHDLYNNTLIVFMSDNCAAAEDFYNDPKYGSYIDYTRFVHDQDYVTVHSHGGHAMIRKGQYVSLPGVGCA